MREKCGKFKFFKSLHWGDNYNYLRFNFGSNMILFSINISESACAVVEIVVPKNLWSNNPCEISRGPSEKSPKIRGWICEAVTSPQREAGPVSTERIQLSGNKPLLSPLEDVKRWLLDVSVIFEFCHYSKRARTCCLLCKRPGCYHSTSKTHVRDRIFKLSPIHASVIYQIPWIPWIQWISLPLRENSIYHVLPDKESLEEMDIWSIQVKDISKS